jgi:uncharacterized membrane protein
VLLIPATAALAWSLYSRKSVTVLASLAVAASSALIEYSTNARGYSMLALFVVLAAWAATGAMRTPQQRWRWLTWGGLCAAGTYTVPIMLLPVAGMVSVICGAHFGADRAKRGAVLRGLGVGLSALAAGVFVAYLPFLLVRGMSAFSDSHELANSILAHQIPSAWEMLRQMWELWVRHASSFLIVVGAIGAAVFVGHAVRMANAERVFLPAIVIVPLLLAIIANAPMPPRTWVFALPILAVVVAGGACALGDLFCRLSGATGVVGTRPYGNAVDGALTSPATHYRPSKASTASGVLRAATPTLLAVGLAALEARRTGV